MQQDFHGVVFLTIINYVNALSLLSQHGPISLVICGMVFPYKYNQCTTLTLKTMNEIFEVRQMLAMIWFK